jgi:hypothetical protein
VVVKGHEHHQQQRTYQRAMELDELSWRSALKLVDLDRREYYHKQTQEKLLTDPRRA